MFVPPKIQETLCHLFRWPGSLEGRGTATSSPQNPKNEPDPAGKTELNPIKKQRPKIALQENLYQPNDSEW
jgi:hypothetical protein